MRELPHGPYVKASAENPKVRRLNWSDAPAVALFVAPWLAFAAAWRTIRRDYR